MQPKPRVGSFSYSILSPSHIFLNVSVLILRGTEHFSLNLFYLCLFATQQVLFSSKVSILTLYGERNNCSVGAKVTDLEQSDLNLWLLLNRKPFPSFSVPRLHSSFKSLFPEPFQQNAYWGGGWKSGAWVFCTKQSSHLYILLNILFFSQNLYTNLHYFKVDNCCFSSKAFVFSSFLVLRG